MARIPEIRLMHSKAIRIPEILQQRKARIFEIRLMHSKAIRIPEILQQSKARIPEMRPNTPAEKG